MTIGEAVAALYSAKTEEEKIEARRQLEDAKRKLVEETRNEGIELIFE